MYLYIAIVTSVFWGYREKENENQCYRNDSKENEKEIVKGRQKFL